MHATSASKQGSGWRLPLRCPRSPLWSTGENPDSLLAGKAGRFVRAAAAGDAPFFL